MVRLARVGIGLMQAGAPFPEEPMPRFAAPTLALALLLSGPALAAAPDTVWLEELTWTELRDLVAAGTTTIIVPIGGVEQSGPDIALGKHDARARVLGERIARALGHTLLAPVVAYVPEGGIDPPTAHMRFPGTITVPPDVFRKTVASAAESFKLAGFRDVVFIGEHGSYQGDLAAVAAELNRRWGATPVRAHFVRDYYWAATGGYYPLLKGRGFSAAEIGTHAGVADTSLSMAVAPDTVRTDALKGGAHLDAADGVYGAPERSSAAVGLLAADAVVAKSVDAIRADIARAPRR